MLYFRENFRALGLVLVVLELHLLQLCLGATPLLIPNKQESYEFDLNLQWTISMTSHGDGEAVRILQWDVDLASFMERIKTQSTGCDHKTMLNPDDPVSDTIFLDGLHHRIIAINGQSPGPPIVVHRGAKVALRVNNGLTGEGISLHVHGMRHQGTWFMDGAAFITQCPIHSKSIFTYRFIADSPGTLFYHGHLLTDRAMGLLGPFIVVDEDNEDKYDVQYALTLQEWVLLDMEKTFMLGLGGYEKFYYGLENEKDCWVSKRTYDGSDVGGSAPMAILFNQKGWHVQDDILSQPQNLNLEVFEIKPGESVLFRTIHGGRNEPLTISVQDHQLKVVAMDGEQITPVVVDMIMLNPGERFDFVIIGKEDPSCSSYYILAENVQAFDKYWKPVNPTYGLAVLKYQGVAPELRVDCSLIDWKHYLPCSEDGICTVLNCPWESFPSRNDFKCLNLNQIKSKQLMPQEMAQKYYNGPNLYSEHFINFNSHYYTDGHRFQYPIAPPYANPSGAGSIWIPCTPSTLHCMYTVEASLGSVVQLTVYNMGLGSKGEHGRHHPLHIHGNHFYLIKQVFGPQHQFNGTIIGQSNDILQCDEKSLCPGQKWSNSSWMNGNVGLANLFNPPLKDTVMVPMGGYVVLRLKADNPGYWTAHCHIIFHHLRGMAFVLKVGKDMQMPAPPQNSNMMTSCGILDPLGT